MIHQSTRRPAKTPKFGQVRIIGGQWRGRRIKFMQVSGLRPTLDRVRETLFNWLMHDISDARCLDLFAGSGALGFEALSRGASEVVFVEKHPKAANFLRENAQELNFINAKVLNTSAEVAFKKNSIPFDIIFIDPPFHQDYLTEVLNSLNHANMLHSGTLIYVEREKSAESLPYPQNWSLKKHKKIGGLEFFLLEVN